MKPGRAGRLLAGMLALAALALLLSQAVRLPGPAGGVLRRNAAGGRDAAALLSCCLCPCSGTLQD